MSLVAPTRNTFAIEDELGCRRGSVLNHVQEEKPMELLAPAGTLEKGKTAIACGANVVLGRSAIWFAGQGWQFLVKRTWRRWLPMPMNGGVVYVTANIIPHNRDLVGVHEYFQRLGELVSTH